MPIKDNIKRPPPRWWRNFEDGMLMILIPATVAIIMSWGFPDVITTKIILVINVGVVAIIKFIGKLISNGEVYATENTLTVSETKTTELTAVDATKPDLSGLKAAAPNDDQLKQS